LDAGETDEGLPYLVMELLEGRTLEGILAVRRQIEVADAVFLGMQLCDALAAAHERGILHRDLKPSNMFISRTEAGREVVKVFDFGIARLPQQEQKITQENAVLGTPEYMAPEQLLARDDLDARCDIYGLGISLYEALAGVVPFEGNFGEVLLKVSIESMPSLTKRCPQVPVELERAIAKAIARDPADRHASMRAFAEALSQVPLGNAQLSSLLGLRGAVGTGAHAALPSLDSASTRRRFARAPYVTPTRIFRPNGSTLDGRSEDISVGGLLVLAPQAFDQAERVTVRFALPITGKLLDVPAIARWVKMARGTGAVGLQFVDLAPDHTLVIESYVTALGGE
jgi:serine/threonine protein kinase